MNWQPIETAPAEIMVMIYQPSEDGTHWFDIARCCDGVWYGRDDTWSTEAPTHWAPLVTPSGIEVREG